MARSTLFPGVLRSVFVGLALPVLGCSSPSFLIDAEVLRQVEQIPKTLQSQVALRAYPIENQPRAASGGFYRMDQLNIETALPHDGEKYRVTPRASKARLVPGLMVIGVGVFAAGLIAGMGGSQHSPTLSDNNVIGLSVAFAGLTALSFGITGGVLIKRLYVDYPLMTHAPKERPPSDFLWIIDRDRDRDRDRNRAKDRVPQRAARSGVN